MKEDGHDVKVATKHHLGGNLIIENIECFDGAELGVVNEVARVENYDYIISSNDAWALSAYNKLVFDKNKWVPCVFLDTEWIHAHMINAVKNSCYQIAVTQHGKKELERVGFTPAYAPLGVDIDIFRPDSEIRTIFRKKKNWADDKFVIGFVGINYPTDRKNIIGLLKAFQQFHNKYPDTEMYLHTDIMGSATSGLPLNWILGSCGFDKEGKTGPVKAVNQLDYHLWNISRDELVGLYNAFDVFFFPTQGEGFGLPIIEAQACGCPVVVTDTTSGKELTKGGLLIRPTEDDYQYSTLNTWFVKVPPSAIYKKMEIMYKIWKAGKLDKYKKKAREGMLEYSWDAVYAKYWRPTLKILEERKAPVKIKEAEPDWGYLHRQMIGRIMFAGKFDCGNFECKDICNWNFPRILNEPLNDRQVLSRSYPIFPDTDGNLIVNTDCKMSKWLSPRFEDEIKILWEELWSYPRIRDFIKTLWQNGFGFGHTWQRLDTVVHEFDETYAAIMQRYYTTFALTDQLLAKLSKYGTTVLDVGCGNGGRVDILNEKGFEARGMEINKYWVNNKTIFEGSAYSIPYEDESFDIVMSVDVLEHLKDPVVALKEMFRVARKLAVLEITTSSDISIKEDPTHYTMWDPNKWEREVAEFGEIIEKLTSQAWLVKKYDK